MTEFEPKDRFFAHRRRLLTVENCGCPAARYSDGPTDVSYFHLDEPDTTGPAWQALLDLIDECAGDRRTVFAPGLDLEPDLWRQVTILPATISKLTSVEHLLLYGSHLAAIPPEIGDMTALASFEPYTSDRLHWFPYEITRCSALVESPVSTRALYGNLKTRAIFPLLPATVPTGCVPPVCSVCRGEFGDYGPIQCWYSLRVATDTLPLLVYACSTTCLDTLRQPAEPDAAYPHLGGHKRSPAQQR
jgi:hypothetical protein